MFVGGELERSFAQAVIAGSARTGALHRANDTGAVSMGRAWETQTVAVRALQAALFPRAQVMAARGPGCKTGGEPRPKREDAGRRLGGKQQKRPRPAAGPPQPPHDTKRTHRTCKSPGLSFTISPEQ